MWSRFSKVRMGPADMLEAVEGAAMARYAMELSEALRELVHLHDNRDKMEKQEYQRRKPQAWERARKALTRYYGSRPHHDKHAID